MVHWWVLLHPGFLVNDTPCDLKACPVNGQDIFRVFAFCAFLHEDVTVIFWLFVLED
jgi:hypothetical protein